MLDIFPKVFEVPLLILSLVSSLTPLAYLSTVLDIFSFCSANFLFLFEGCIEEIVEADAVIKGQTVSSSFKPAILKNGVKVMVPGHIEVGTKIVIRPSDCTYVEKAKT